MKTKKDMETLLASARGRMARIVETDPNSKDRDPMRAVITILIWAADLEPENEDETRGLDTVKSIFEMSNMTMKIKRVAERFKRDETQDYR